MTITEFIKKYAMTERDSHVCKSVYKSIDKTEQAWKDELKGVAIFKDREIKDIEVINPIEEKVLVEEKSLSPKEIKKAALIERVNKKQNKNQ